MWFISEILKSFATLQFELNELKRRHGETEGNGQADTDSNTKRVRTFRFVRDFKLLFALQIQGFVSEVKSEHLK